MIWCQKCKHDITDYKILYIHITVVFLDAPNAEMEVNISISLSPLHVGSFQMHRPFMQKAKSVGGGYIFYTIFSFTAMAFLYTQTRKEYLQGNFQQAFNTYIIILIVSQNTFCLL